MYHNARERYAASGVDTDKAITKLEKISISLHCWQGDDISGFENHRGVLIRGLIATGNYLSHIRGQLIQHLFWNHWFIPQLHHIAPQLHH